MATETTQLLQSRPVPELGSGISKRAQRQRHRKGLALSALSALAFALMSLFVRQLSDKGYSSLQIMSYRSFVQAIVSILTSQLLLGINPFSIKKYKWQQFKWVLSRAIFGDLGHLLYYAALGQMSMGIATVLFFTNPLFTSLMAYWILREPFSSRHRLLLILCFSGILLVVKPTNMLSDTLVWSLAALLGANSSAFAYVSVRLATSAIHPMIHVCYLGIVGSIVCPLVQVFLLNEPVWYAGAITLPDALIIVMVGLMAFFAQFLMNWGLQLTNAGPVVMMRNADIVISFIFDILIYHTLPDIVSFIGAAVITVSVILMGL
ncbi:hypothetical protein GGI12_003179 [Dipsacomyces acuminosporus]|nr:hypothetical protein GGI12_003179 [Dipsacomyces acuminosporus]